MNWISLAGVLPQKIKTLGLEKFFQLAQLRSDWDDFVVEIIGDKFAQKSKPINLKDEVLIVDCLNSVWANEFKMREGWILEEIKKHHSRLKISKISFIS